jgi:phage terminase large subunit-like protein
MVTNRTSVDTGKVAAKGRRASVLKTEPKAIQELQKAALVPSKELKGSSDLAVRALSDMTAFAELIMFHGGWENFGECHKELADFISTPQRSKEAQWRLKAEGDEQGAYLRRLVLMPRGHLKSTIGTVLYTLWRIYRNPNIRILVACNLQQLAFAFIRELRSYFENTKLDVVWNNRPHIEGALLPQLQKKSRDRNFSVDTEAEDRKVIWNNTALQVVRRDNVYFKEPTVFATSVGTTVTGQHYDLVILDDLIDFKNIESEVKKNATEEWIADVESVLNPPENCTIEGKDGYVLQEILGGEIVINGTRYAVDDYYAQVIEKADELGYQTHIRNVYKNGKDNAAGYLWHEKYNDRTVASLKARLSPRRFSSQYLNTVYEKDTSLFNTQAITILPNDSVFTSGGRLCARHPSGRVEVVAPILAIDPAFTTSKTSDDCSILLGFKFSDGMLCVVDAFLDRMIAAEVVKNTSYLAQTYNTLRLFYEANGVGLLVPELFKTDASKVDGKQIICTGHYEQRSKESKIQGVLELPMNVGKIAMCQRVRDNERIWKQLVNYPAVRHDDFLDGLVTLFEKTIPSREIYKSQLQDISINGVPLRVANLSDNRLKQETYLSAYNSEYFI